MTRPRFARITLSHHDSARQPKPFDPRSGLDRQSGFAGGAEVLPFGLLIFVVGALLVTNAWAVIDTKMATTSAAREGARAYVESPSAGAGASAAEDAARGAIAAYGKKPGELDMSIEDGGSFVRCDRVTVEARYQVPAFSLPFGIGFGHGFTAVSRHSEIIDPLRNGLGRVNSCGY